MSADTSNTSEGRVRDQHEPFHAVSLAASLTVKDLPRSMAWYRDVLHFTVDQQMERDGKVRAVAVKAGAVRILLNQDDGAKGANRITGVGLSLMLTTTQNIDTLAAQIKSHGGVLESEPADMPWGARVFRLQDPDGFKFVISSER